MKKIFIVFMLIIISLSFIACNGKRDINASFSEITYVYFQYFFLAIHNKSL